MPTVSMVLAALVVGLFRGARVALAGLAAVAVLAALVASSGCDDVRVVRESPSEAFTKVPGERADGAPRRAEPAELEKRAELDAGTPQDLRLDAIADATQRAAVAEVVASARRGPPFPYKKDGTVFRNAERRLPSKPSGYYREFTVTTPGAPTRGARRVIAGAGGEFYYTADHYGSFVRLDRGPP